jgi:hypothetical protein
VLACSASWRELGAEGGAHSSTLAAATKAMRARLEARNAAREEARPIRIALTGRPPDRELEHVLRSLGVHPVNFSDLAIAHAEQL